MDGTVKPSADKYISAVEGLKELFVGCQEQEM
jgi:hypothetical protein